jgi:hypothetical protein
MLARVGARVLCVEEKTLSCSHIQTKNSFPRSTLVRAENANSKAAYILNLRSKYFEYKTLYTNKSQSMYKNARTKVVG